MQIIFQITSIQRRVDRSWRKREYERSVVSIAQTVQANTPRVVFGRTEMKLDPFSSCRVRRHWNKSRPYRRLCVLSSADGSWDFPPAAPDGEIEEIADFSAKEIARVRSQPQHCGMVREGVDLALTQDPARLTHIEDTLTRTARGTAIPRQAGGGSPRELREQIRPLAQQLGVIALANRCIS